MFSPRALNTAGSAFRARPLTSMRRLSLPFPPRPDFCHGRRRSGRHRDRGRRDHHGSSAITSAGLIMRRMLESQESLYL